MAGNGCSGAIALVPASPWLGPLSRLFRVFIDLWDDDFSDGIRLRPRFVPSNVADADAQVFVGIDRRLLYLSCRLFCRDSGFCFSLAIGCFVGAIGLRRLVFRVLACFHVSGGRYCARRLFDSRK